jgi:predicted kinase
VSAPLLLISGPAGAGKTVLADAWARRQTHPTLHLSLDDVRERVKSGYANPEHGASPAMLEQLDRARQGCAQLARLYTARGYGCVIDDVIFPHWPPACYALWQQALGATPHRLVVLLPAFAAVQARNQQRSGQHRLQERTLRLIYGRMTPWRAIEGVTILDNTVLSVDETVALLDAALDRPVN